jgi:hypothetical protein
MFDLLLAGGAIVYIIIFLNSHAVVIASRIAKYWLNNPESSSLE